MKKILTKSLKLALITAITFSPSVTYAASFSFDAGETIEEGQVLNGDNQTGFIGLDSNIEIPNNVGSDAILIEQDVSGVVITNRGDVSNENNFHGINDKGINTKIINSGSINANDGADSVAIYSTGRNINITNSNRIDGRKRAIELLGENATIVNSGSIYGYTQNNATIRSTAANLTITNKLSGLIDGNNNGSPAILTEGDNAAIENIGRIRSNSNDGIGIQSTGDNLVINNKGEISTRGQAILLDAGDGASITNSGFILSTTGYAIYTEGVRSNISILNSGTISSLEGIYLDGANSYVENNGNIIGRLDLDNSSQNSSIINNGDILAADSQAININSADNVTITNSGLISGYSGGIRAGVGSSSAVILNNGKINSSRFDGVDLDGTDITFTNNGEIFGGRSGADSDGDNLTIINNGEISGYEQGVYVGGTNSTIVNNGTISVSQAGAIAVKYEDFEDDEDATSTGTLTNSGKIIANGEATIAIQGSYVAQNLILGGGSEITGTIDLRDGTDSITINRHNMSARLVASNVENVTFSNAAGVVVGDSIYVVDATSNAMLATNINNLSLDIHGAINSRNNSQGKERFWTQAFGSKFERGSEGSNLSYSHDRVGVISGYEYGQGEDRFGVIAGLSTSDSKSDKNRSFENESSSLFAGVYKNFNLGDSTTLTTNLIVGYEKYETKRFLLDSINGYETADSDFDNIFISPSIKLENKIKISDLFELRPNLGASYTSSYVGSYQEKGSTSSNVSTKNRRIQTINAEAGLASVLNLKYAQLKLGLGADSRFIEQDDVKANIDNVAFTYALQNDNEVFGRFLEVGFNIINFQDLTFGLNARLRKAGGNEEQKSLRFDFGYKF